MLVSKYPWPLLIATSGTWATVSVIAILSDSKDRMECTMEIWPVSHCERGNWAKSETRALISVVQSSLQKAFKPSLMHCQDGALCMSMHSSYMLNDWCSTCILKRMSQKFESNLMYDLSSFKHSLFPFTQPSY